MIRFINFSLSRGTKALFSQADLTLNPGERIGLIGANGAGKSSLFALIRGELHPDQGDFQFPAQWQLAHVAQETPAISQTAIEFTLDGDVKLRELEKELAELESQTPASPSSQSQDEHHAELAELGIRIAQLHSNLADHQAYTARSRAEQLLLGLGFTMNQLEKNVSEFSGGWRMRLNLAQALMCPSDILLLDEPTNHLDLDTIIWLEDWLKRYQGTLIIISHDRDFLDGIVNVIVHIDEQKLKRYSGHYSSFERQRAAQLVLQQQAIDKQSRQRAHLQSFIDRFKAKATKAKQAQSRMKALEKMEELAPLRAAAEFSFEFKTPDNAPNPMLVMDKVNCGYDAHSPIVKDVNFSLQIGQRIGLLGINGAGKSTFIKTIVNEIEKLAGHIQLGKGLKIGYFAQHQVDKLRLDETPLWHLSHLDPNAREQDLRNFLGSFNFAGEMATSVIAPFSGGEKARLALAMIVWEKPNLLLLDEPTNHLDLETREALTDALAQFEGTLIIVSHDRHLLRATTEQFFIIEQGKVQAFDGDLDDYKVWLYQTKLKALQDIKIESQTTSDTSHSSHTKATQTISDKERKRLEAEERQRLSALRKPIETQIKKLETQMQKWEERKTQLDTQLSSGDIYEESQKENLKALLLEQAQVTKELDAIEMQWLEKTTTLEAIV